MSDIQHLIKRILAFRDERDWKQFHTPKELAISIAIEAGELLENFQWRSRGEKAHIDAHKEEIGEELADVFMLSFLLAEELGLDVEKIVENKLEKNAKKYPADKARGKDKKWSEYQ